MWISKNNVSKNVNEYSNVENAYLTISNDEQVEVNGSSSSRDIRVYAPYGYSFIAPSGLEGLVLDASFGKAISGFRMGNNSIKTGEIKIENKSGAYILLKNDGTVEINGQVFNKGGTKNDIK